MSQITGRDFVAVFVAAFVENWVNRQRFRQRPRPRPLAQNHFGVARVVSHLAFQVVGFGDWINMGHACFLFMNPDGARVVLNSQTRQLRVEDNSRSVRAYAKRMEAPKTCMLTTDKTSCNNSSCLLL